jgi:hypothetical protein
MMDWNRKLPQLPSGEEPKEPHGFVTVHVADAEGLNKAVSACEPHDWILRVHYPEPDKPEPSPEMKLAATLDEMRAEIDALKARVA